MHAVLSPIGISVAAESIGVAMFEVSARRSGFANGTILENKDIVLLSEL